MSSRMLQAAVFAGAIATSIGAPAANAQALATARRAPADPLSPPAVCTRTAIDWRNAQTAPALAEYRKATDSTRAEAMRKFSVALNESAAAGARMSADCAAKFNVATIPVAQLTDLIALYTSARDTTGARRATERLLAAKGLPSRTRGQALMFAMKQEAVRDPNYFGMIAGAEKYSALIDQLPDSLSDIKLEAHHSMLGRYEYLDVAEGLHTHALAVIALARSLHKNQAMISGYSSLARSYADRLHPDSAMKILDAGEKEIGDSASGSFADFRNRYALIGTPAATVTAEWWINPDAQSVVVPSPGRVTLIEFTAHWCGPCKNSYPGLRGLSDRFKGKPFDGVMVTQLYGYLDTQRDLTPAQEVAADREYFGKQHALPFPVAINSPVKQVTPFTPGRPFAQPQPDMDYRVGGIPQIMIIDKKGIIRQIVTGWDQGNTERFSKLIEQLMAEKL